MALVVTLLSVGAAALSPSARDSGLDSGVDIAVSGGKSIQLRGHVEPTIISVTMPSYIPFDISKMVEGENKVVSPRIDVTNHSLVPVSVSVDYASVDLSRLPGVTWSGTGVVNNTQIAVGFTEADAQPTTLYGANWLKRGEQNTSLLALNARDEGTLYLVGAIGVDVPENRTFTVTPTLVVRAGN